MNAASKKAILIVSFGTSYENTRKRTIDAIERDIADAFPVCPAYRAWTSKMIIAKLKKRDGIIIHTVKEAMEQFQDMDQETALVLMGHGTEHYANSVYAALDYRFKDMGHKNIFLGTVEAYPALDSLLRAADSFQPKKIVLAPFMIVAGDHAQNDLAGEDPDSWMNRLSSEGYEVTPVLKGLGEYPKIRQILVDHVQQAMDASI